MEEELKEFGLHVEHSVSPEDKQKKYSHEWYLKHRDEVLARSRKRYEEHKNEIKEYKKQHHVKYYDENKDKILEYGKRWHWGNRDKVLSRQAQYRENNKEKIKKHNEEYRKKHREEAREYLKERRITKIGNAHNKVWELIKNGKIQKQPCELCGSEMAEAHHDNYNKPLEIRWLCKKCHAEWHKNNKPIYIQKELA